MKKVSLLLPVISGVATICGVGVAAAQDLYVSNNGNNSIAIIAPGGSTTEVSSPLLNLPTGMAFNSEGDLFIANNGGDIVEYNPTSGLFTNFATGTTALRGLAFDSEGNLYVASQNTGVITEYVGGIDDPKTFAKGLNTPNGIAIDSLGDLYVGLGANADALARITPGGVVTTFDTSGVGLNNPNGLAFGPDDDLYVVNKNDPSVEKVTSNLVGSTFISSAPANGLNSSKDIAFDSNGNLYVTDFGDNKVTEYNAAGHLIDTFSTDINGPCYLAFGPAGDLSVPEPGTYAMLLVGLGMLYFFRRRRMALARI